MQTKLYNPSILEVKITQAIEDLKEEIQEKLKGYKVKEVVKHADLDNPALVFRVTDKDSDIHEVVIKVIQRNDEFIHH